MIHKKDLLFLSIISSVFLFLAIYNIYYVGFSADEVSPGLWGAYLFKGKDINFCSSVNINILGKRFPVDFIQSYTFALPCYMLIPFFILFGINVFSLKLLSILLSWSSLIMLYYVVVFLFNKKIAVITTLLLGLSPTFIHYTRIGLHVTETVLNFFFIGGVFFSLLYYNKRRFFFACMASYLFGAGLSIKLSFLPRLIGLFCVLMLIYNRRFFSFIQRNFKIKHIIAVIFSFCLGAFLFIYYNIATKGNTFKLMRYLYSQESTPCGVNNRDFLKNIKTRIAHAKSIITEDTISEHNGFIVPISKKVNSLVQINVTIIFLTFLSALMFNLLVLKTNMLAWNNVLGIYIIYGIIFLFSFFTPYSMRDFHMASLFAFPQIILGIAIENLSSIIRRSHLAIIWKSSLIMSICGIILIPILTVDIGLNYIYHANLKRTGGKSYWSPVIYEILEYIKINNIAKYPIYCSDWAWNSILPFITDDNVDFKYDVYEYASKDTLYDNLKRILEKYSVVYFISRHESRHFDLLKDYMVRLDRRIILETSFYNKAKEPLFHLYRIE